MFACAFKNEIGIRHLHLRLSLCVYITNVFQGHFVGARTDQCWLVFQWHDTLLAFSTSSQCPLAGTPAISC